MFNFVPRQAKRPALVGNSLLLLLFAEVQELHPCPPNFPERDGSGRTVRGLALAVRRGVTGSLNWRAPVNGAGDVADLGLRISGTGLTRRKYNPSTGRRDKSGGPRKFADPSASCPTVDAPRRNSLAGRGTELPPGSASFRVRSS